MSSRKKAARWVPMLALASQVTPPGFRRRTPATTAASVAEPPKVGVKPPGNRSWNEKHRSSAKTRARASGSGTWSTTRTTGQFAEPAPSAARVSPTSSVCPPSALKTPPRVFGLRKKKLPLTVRFAYPAWP